VRGVLLMHSFQYAEAATAFRRAQSLDSHFALAFWGEALTYTHQVWNEQDLPAARAALQKLGATPDARLAAAPTPRERAYGTAVEALYGDGAKAVAIRCIPWRWNVCTVSSLTMTRRLSLRDVAVRSDAGRA